MIEYLPPWMRVLRWPKKGESMDCYLECLEALSHLLELCGESYWKSWIDQDIKLWQEQKSAKHHLAAYGGMDSLNDLFLCGENKHTVTDEQCPWVNALLMKTKSLSYQFAKVAPKKLSFRKIGNKELEEGHVIEGWRCLTSCNYAEVSPNGIDNFLTRYFVDICIVDELGRGRLKQFIDDVYHIRLEGLDEKRAKYRKLLDESGIIVCDREGWLRPCPKCSSSNTAVYRWELDKSGKKFVPSKANLQMQGTK